MTWRDARFGLAIAILTALGHWLIQGLWLGLHRPISWAVSAAGVFTVTLVLRAALREQRRRMASDDVSGADRKAK